jgi:hypothetical protein
MGSKANKRMACQCDVQTCASMPRGDSPLRQ